MLKASPVAALALVFACGGSSPSSSPGDGTEDAGDGSSSGSASGSGSGGEQQGSSSSGSSSGGATASSSGGSSGGSTTGSSSGGGKSGSSSGGGKSGSSSGGGKSGSSSGSSSGGGKSGSSSGSSGSSSGGQAGQVEISDQFQVGTDSMTIQGMSPDVTDLPGGTWSMDSVNVSGSDFEAFIDTGAGNPAPSLHLYDVGGSTGSAAIPIGSAGSYSKPAQFSIKVDIKELNPGMVLLVGFYGSPPSQGAAAIAGFTGLGYHTDTGDLDLIEDGVTKTTQSFTGSFDEGNFNTLSYSVDTTTGAISGANVTGSTGTFTFSTSAFTDAATQYVVFGTETGGAQGACQYFDNLLITAE
jgi:hypothetical protein